MTGESVMVIAEVGSTHEGDLDQMKHLVAQAAAAGADVVKFQWLSDAQALARHRRAQAFQSAYRTLAFDPSWHPILREECARHHRRYGCSVYLEEDIATVVRHADVVKIASFEAGDIPFVTAVLFAAKTKEIPVVISLGGRSQQEALSIYQELYSRFKSFGWYWPKIRFLHCISAYPCDTKDLQLHVIRDARTLQGDSLYQGFSDHTTSTETGSWAVMAGAQIIEKHIRLAETSITNADFPVSLPPWQFTIYVEKLREAERARGLSTRSRYRTESETPFTRYLRGTV